MCNEFYKLNSSSVYCWPGPGVIPWKNHSSLVSITYLTTAIEVNVDTLAAEYIISNNSCSHREFPIGPFFKIVLLVLYLN